MVMTLNNLIAALPGLDDEDLAELRDAIDDELEERGADDVLDADEADEEEEEEE